jgi:tripeptidyl-peptidase I
LTPFYEEKQYNEYMKLGLQGVTVLYSSVSLSPYNLQFACYVEANKLKQGDYGVAGNGGQCLNANGTFTPPGANYGQFNPSFPETFPYVTSVGATQVATGSTSHTT